MKLTGINPLSGQKVDVLNPSSYAEGAIGVAWLTLIVAGGLYAFKRLQRATAGTPVGPMTALPWGGGSAIPAKVRIVQGL